MNSRGCLGSTANQHSQSGPIRAEFDWIDKKLTNITFNLQFYEKNLEIWVFQFFMYDILSTTGVYYVKSLSFKRAIDFILRHFYLCSSWLYIHQSLNICKLNFPFVYQFYTRLTAILESTFLNLAELFIFKVFHNNFKIFWYGVYSSLQKINTNVTNVLTKGSGESINLIERLDHIIVARMIDSHQYCTLYQRQTNLCWMKMTT